MLKQISVTGQLKRGVAIDRDGSDPRRRQKDVNFRLPTGFKAKKEFHSGTLKKPPIHWDWISQLRPSRTPINLVWNSSQLHPHSQPCSSSCAVALPENCRQTKKLTMTHLSNPTHPMPSSHQTTPSILQIWSLRSVQSFGPWVGSRELEAVAPSEKSEPGSFNLLVCWSLRLRLSHLGYVQCINLYHASYASSENEDEPWSNYTMNLLSRGKVKNTYTWL